MTGKKRILSGMRPTGPLHLGNLHGALANWIKQQDNYDCFFFIADWHALTSDYEDTGSIPDNIRNMMVDWLSTGLSPEKSTLFVQSQVKEHAELFLLLSMITPVPWLERNPTYKDQILQLSNKDLSTFGFLGYPVLQASDIIIYKADCVPVGIDQVPHVEITREIARRFNNF
jgi:tryptophanyl-tRNA synthetase